MHPQAHTVSDRPSIVPPSETPRHRPCSPNIGAVAEDMSPYLSALVMARNIERLQDIKYAEGIRGPREDLNKDAKDGKFRYDRDFLMQFMQLCKEKPPDLPPLDILGIKPMDQSTLSMTLGGRHRQPASAIPPTPPQRLVGLRASASLKPGSVPGPFPIGSLSMPTSKLASEEPYMMSTTGTLSASDGPCEHPEVSKGKRVKQVQLKQEKNGTKEWASEAVEDRKRTEGEVQRVQEVQLDAEEAQDAVEYPIEDSEDPEEGGIIENREIVETQVGGGSVSKPPKVPKEALRIDTPSMPPPLEIPRRRPGPLDIGAVKRDVSAAPLSTLAMARNIERLQDIEYPEGVRSPREDLNKDAKDGKFRYDRDFLMQFMQLCKEKPPNLPPLDILGIEPMDQSAFSMARGGSGRHRQPASAIPPARRNSVGLGISGNFGVKPGAAPGPFAMGQFSTPTSKLTSEERYMMSTAGTRSASVSTSPASLQFVRPMTRTASQGGLRGHPMGSKRTRSKRSKIALSLQGEGRDFGAPGVAPIVEAAPGPVELL